MKSKSLNAAQGTEPEAVPAKRKPPIAAIRAFIAAQGRTAVYVHKDYAPSFRKPPRDGNVYIVEDPKRPGVLHWTDRMGRYRCLDEKMVKKGSKLHVNFDIKTARSANKQRLARRIEHLPASVSLVSVPDADPVPVRLIKLERVMQITGFSKSFLYEQTDFPQPVKLGVSKRAAVRWSEVEVTAWVNKLLTARDGHAEE